MNSSEPGDLDPSMREAGVERNRFDGIVYYVANDTEKLYILVDFVSARLFQLANDFGFTLYVDSPESVSRSFGITYPTGVYYELGQYPGAQNGFIAQPNWSNIPENKSMMESAERNMTRQALISQRQSRRDKIQPVPIRLPQLRAQNLLIHYNDDGRSGRLSFTIPLETRSTSQFSPDINPGETISIGFEINPIRLFNLDERTTTPLITSDPSGGRTQSETKEQERQREELMRIMQQLGEPYEEWVDVQLAEPEA